MSRVRGALRCGHRLLLEHVAVAHELDDERRLEDARVARHVERQGHGRAGTGRLDEDHREKVGAGETGVCDVVVDGKATVVVGVDVDPQPAASAVRASRNGRRVLHESECVRASGGARRRWPRCPYPVSVSLIAIVLLVAAVVLVAATEWPRFSRRTGIDTNLRRERKRRKSHLRVVKTETDDFAKAVERDLAALPTIDDRD
jgi:hypothetical protein